MARVRELRLCVTAGDCDAAPRFYRDVHGMREREAYEDAEHAERGA